MTDRTTKSPPLMEPEQLEKLRQSGIMTAQDLASVVDADKGNVDLVQGLLRRRTVNLLIGDSTIGKTPLMLLLALCIAFGKQFLGRPVQRGTVFYIDGESDQQHFLSQLNTIVAFLGESAVPDSFMFWSPNFSDHITNVSLANQGIIHARRVAADFTVIDTLRSFFPKAETDSREAMKMIIDLRSLVRETSTTIMLPHHIRKADRKAKRPDLESNPQGWFEEAAGMRAIINGTDLRLGMEAQADTSTSATCCCAEYAVVSGKSGPIFLERMYDADGDPQGYRRLDGVALLNVKDQQTLHKLPSRLEPFRFTDAHKAVGGKSKSNTKRFLDRCINVRLVCRSGDQYMRL